MAKMFRGRPACSCLIKWLPAYEAELLRRGVIKRSLDIYQLIGGSPKSASTHTKGGAADLGQTSDEAIWVARQMGADAAWHRPHNWDGKGGIEHTHLVLRGCPHNGPARYQIVAVDAGFNGLGHLGRGGRDTGPRPLSKRTWRQGIKWARAQRADELDLIAWNVWEGNKPGRVVDAVKEMAERYKPDVFVLNEATRCHDELEAAAPALGFKLLQEPPIPRVSGRIVHEQGATAVLVRRGAGVEVTWDSVVAMRRAWTGPKHGLKHGPRRHQRINLKVRGRRWGLAAVHWPTRTPAANAKARADEKRRCHRWLVRAPWRANVEVGDTNTSARELRPWAALFGAEVSGAGVDLAIHRRCTADAFAIDEYGSDHPAIHYRFTASKGSVR